jgi:Transposase
MGKVWSGVDTGKAHHHCVVIDAEGRRLLSRRVANDEPELERLISEVTALGEQVTWAADMAGGGAALLIGLLAAAGQRLLYLPGHALAHAAEGYRGEGKTDLLTPGTPRSSPTRPACAATCSPIRPGDEITAELKILTERRKDLSCDRTRAINRIRGLLTGIFPALERELDLTCTGPLVLQTGYQAPAAIRRTGPARLEAWLRARHGHRAASLAAAACRRPRGLGRLHGPQRVGTQGRGVLRGTEQTLGFAVTRTRASRRAAGWEPRW